MKPVVAENGVNGCGCSSRSGGGVERQDNEEEESIHIKWRVKERSS